LIPSDQPFSESTNMRLTCASGRSVRGVESPVTTDGRSLTCVSRRFRFFELLEQRRKHPYLLWLPVGDERAESMETDLRETLEFPSAWGGERNATRAVVYGVCGHLEEPLILEVSDLSGDLRGVHALSTGDFGRTNAPSGSDNLQKTQGVRSFFLAPCPIECCVRHEQGRDHRADLFSAGLHGRFMVSFN
jgi:hypothetical protein